MHCIVVESVQCNACAKPINGVASLTCGKPKGCLVWRTYWYFSWSLNQALVSPSALREADRTLAKLGPVPRSASCVESGPGLLLPAGAALAFLGYCRSTCVFKREPH